MAIAFEARHVGTVLRAAAVGIAALLAAPALGASANAAPARPGAVTASDGLVQTVAARKATRSSNKATRSSKLRRGKVYSQRVVVRRGYDDRTPALLGAVATGVLGAVIAGGMHRNDYYDDGPVYVQYPYGGGYGYQAPRPRYYGGDGYDRRYWRGGAPRHVEPAPGYVQPRGGRWGGERPVIRQDAPRGGGFVGRGGWAPQASPAPMNPNLPAGQPPMVRDTAGNWMPNTYSGEGSGR